MHKSEKEISREQPQAEGQPDLGQVQTDPVNPAHSIEQRLAMAEEKAVQNQELYLRARAESENIRRRAQEDIAKAHKFAIESFAEVLVPVKDSLEAALAQTVPDIEKLKEGVDLTLKQLISAFEKGRIQEINPIGQKFDPHLHQAVAMVPAPDGVEANYVVSVMQKGYLLADRVIRPALVSVAQANSG